MRYLGCYVSCAGGLYKGIENGEKLGVNTIMMHPTPPQKWNTKETEEDVIIKYNNIKAKSKIKKIFFHGIYLINLANPDKQKFHLSKVSLVRYLELAEKINCDGVIFHVGSFKEIGEKEGFERIIFGINWIFEHAQGNSKLLLESAAGSGNIVGDKFEDLRKIYDGIEDKKRIGFCLDSQHMFGSGYNLIDNLDEVIKNADEILGLNNIKAIHLNDSKVDLNSKKDRHENLGEGKIGEIALKNFINHPELKDIPMIMETPACKDVDSAKAEVKKLKEWAK